VLQRDFDHHPELVPTDTMTAVFSEQYEETLRRYVAEFNVIPPTEVWGTPKFRLEITPRSRRPVRTDSAGTGGDVPLCRPPTIPRTSLVEPPVDAVSGFVIPYCRRREP
jgi:hypothetical protein